MSSEEIRKKFLAFFKERGHTIVSSSSLIPDDPSVLLTTAGMQQFKKYYTGEADPMKDFGSKNTASIQKSFRTSDIDEVGDESHLTFFEMLGNFSFGYKPGEPVSPKGGYFKKGAITYAHDFITKEMGLAIDYVSVFEGGDGVPADTESEEIWKSLGVKSIKKFGRTDNFWGPTGNEGPCGPTTEIYINGVEIWNIVFNEYYCKNGKLEKLKTPGVDTGMGLERLVMVSQEKNNIFETDLLQPIMHSIIEIQGDKPIGQIRLIVDHLRAAVFLISDGVLPGKEGRGYIPRRLLRRALTAHYLDVGAGPDKNFFQNPVSIIIDIYKHFYPDLLNNGDRMMSIMQDEVEKYSKILTGTVADLKKLYSRFIGGVDPERLLPNVVVKNNVADIDGSILFRIRETHGVDFEVMKMVMEKWGFSFSERTEKEFDEAYQKHQEKSRAGLEKKFGGHGLILDTGELKAGDEEELKKVTRLHTATHLMQQALRNILGNEVHQAGSDITAERTRFDFTYHRKLTPEEIKKIETEVNEVIARDMPVHFKEMPIEEAKKTGALYFFKEKYPDPVNVYYVGKTIEDAYSKEFCGGPHVTHTREIGRFRILKEEAVGAGVRRIRASVD
ncbi:MAG: alanine--tRNA ligase [Candidatus Liptonbacteria bacterium]|nr:alanine--tRNA ligase [Candidatus Liptonbacteria bacterium]